MAEGPSESGEGFESGLFGGGGAAAEWDAGAGWIILPVVPEAVAGALLVERLNQEVQRRGRTARIRPNLPRAETVCVALLNEPHRRWIGITRLKPESP